MGIEDHIRDIIRQKVNEKVGQEVSVLDRKYLKESYDRVRCEVSAHEYRHHRHCVPDKREPSIKSLEEFRRNTIGSSCLNAGELWDQEEDERLDKEMECAIAWMSMLHSRATGGIKARLRMRAEDRGVRSPI